MDGSPKRVMNQIPARKMRMSRSEIVPPEITKRGMERCS